MMYELGSFRRMAESDLAQMELNRNRGLSPYPSTCFHAQQYAEKVAKDRIVDFGATPKKTNDVVSLMRTLCRLAGVDAPEWAVEDATLLNGCYLRCVRPEAGRDVSAEDAEQACEAALRLVAWMDSLGPGSSGPSARRENPRRCGELIIDDQENQVY